MTDDDRFEDELRSLRPRAASDAARRLTAARLAAPPPKPHTGRRLAGAAVAVSAAAALLAAVLTAGPADTPPRPGAGAENGGDGATAPAGCDCRVRFRRPGTARPVRLAPPSARGRPSAAAPALVRGLPGPSGSLDPDPRAALRS